MKDIYSELFEKIISGYYPPGTKLKQEDIAMEYNISRTPVRVVLQLLDQDGLIHLTPNKGGLVLSFTANEIEEIYEIRKSLELLCLELGASNLSMQSLLELKMEHLENLESDDAEFLAELDAKLHSIIIEATSKHRLKNMMNQLFRLLQEFRSLGFKNKKTKEKMIYEHIEIIDALIMRDTNSAKELMKKHIENSKIIALSQTFKSKHSVGDKTD